MTRPSRSVRLAAVGCALAALGLVGCGPPDPATDPAAPDPLGGVEATLDRLERDLVLPP